MSSTALKLMSVPGMSDALHQAGRSVAEFGRRHLGLSNTQTQRVEKGFQALGLVREIAFQGPTGAAGENRENRRVSVRFEGIRLERTDDSEGGVSVSVQRLSISADSNLERLQGRGQVAGRSQRLSIAAQSVTLVVEITQADPLVLDLDGDGLHTRRLNDGVRFDLDADGKAEQAAWIEAGDAFLALDRNGNGRIDHGGEFFGDQHGAADGFAELAKFDSSGDGRISADDEVFDALLLVYGDGRVDTLGEAGVASIELDAVVPLRQALDGGTLTAVSQFTRTDGRDGVVGDLWLDVVA